MVQGEGERRLLYGRRRGHALSPRQQQLFAELLPTLAIDVTTLPTDRPVVMEIGFGGGEHLAHQARGNPDQLFLGCEPFENGIASLLGVIDDEAIDNIRLYCGDARDILKKLPAGRLTRIDILYPDPWPKRRQRKRRFFGNDTLDLMAAALASDGVIHFASDIDDYVGWALANVAAHPRFDWPACSADDWHLPWPDWPGTRYETKAIKAGRRPSYLTFNRCCEN